MHFSTLAFIHVTFYLISTVLSRSIFVARDTSLSWSACPGEPLFECASFMVPLDYADPTVGNITLPVARLPAQQKQPRLGTIFVNPGGPGVSGIEFLMGGSGGVISTITNGQYDIVSWDPRGVNGSRPQISCGFTSLASLTQFFGNTLPVVGIEARGNFTGQDDIDAFFAKVNETDAKLVETGQRCLETDGGFLKYIGTAAVVRDLVSLADAIEGPGTPINYWGVSYGTVLGNYFVNMFPERVGRVIIDGVVDSVIWATEPTFKLAASSFSSIESVFEGFAQTCSQAGPQKCAFAQTGATTESITGRVRDLIDTAYDLFKAGKSNVSSISVRQFVSAAMYNPTLWDSQLVPQLEQWAGMFANQTTSDPSLGKMSKRSYSSMPLPREVNSSTAAIDPTVQTFLSELSISCVDSIDQQNVTTEDFFQGLLSAIHDVSPTCFWRGVDVFGENYVQYLAGRPYGQAFCHRFPIRAVERFTGPFNHTLANTILVIGNKADPITPLANARKIAGILGPSARLLEQDGFGHTSFAMNSDCTQGVARDYFLHGTLPENGTVCNTDQALFPPNSTLIVPNPSPAASLDSGGRYTTKSQLGLLVLGLLPSLAILL